MVPFLKGKEDITFKELYDITGRELDIWVFDIINYEFIKLSHNTTPNISVVDACVLTSSAFPIFKPTKMKINNKDRIILDGAFYNWFPIDQYDPEETIGFTLKQKQKIRYTIHNSIVSLISFLYNIYTYQNDRIIDLLLQKYKDKGYKYFMIDLKEIFNISSFDLLKITNDLKYKKYLYGYETEINIEI